MAYEGRLREVLKNTFGKDDYEYRMLQRATEAIYEGNKDVCIKMPNNYYELGEQLCFQLPVIAKDNCFAIVISCKTKESKNQVLDLTNKKIRAFHCSTYTPSHIIQTIKHEMCSPFISMKFIYMTPKQFSSAYFQVLLSHLRQNALSYIVFDDFSNYSLDIKNFEVVYKSVNEDKHPNFPIIAITNEDIDDKIIKNLKKLGIRKKLVFDLSKRVDKKKDAMSTSVIIVKKEENSEPLQIAKQKMQQK